MAADSDIDEPAPWVVNLPKRYTASPSNISISSTTSSSGSAFSIDALSSQSSASSVASGCSRSSWNYKDGSVQTTRKPLQSTTNPNESVRPFSHNNCGQSLWQPSIALPAPEHRQNPRRTQQPKTNELQDGNIVTSQCPRPPPTLVRQSERKNNFVDSLVDTTTQMVEAIWPLSAHASSCQTLACSRQPSKMPLRQFVQEVLKRSKTSYSTLQVALYYLILIRPLLPVCDFTREQPEESDSTYSLQCGRRMFISALILASKYLQDRNFSANAWSKISGLSTWDLNVNEIAFLSTIGWKLHMPERLFNRWTDIVLKYSPSSQVGLSPRHYTTNQMPWKEIVLRLAPDLDETDFGNAELSDDSGYGSPGSDMTPPLLPLRDEIVSKADDATPTPSTSIPQWLAQTPENSSAEQRAKAIQPATLPPLQPHLGPLPTPDFTPQMGPMSTPAANTYGPRRPSMGQAMAQIDESSWNRCTLDKPSEWRPRVPTFPTLARRSSLATTASSMSSPESISDASTQYSDASARPSRSSSISSVASSTWAPVQSAKLAVQATRRCANMHLSMVKDQPQANVTSATDDGIPSLEQAAKTERVAPQPNENALSQGMKDHLRRTCFGGEESQNSFTPPTSPGKQQAQPNRAPIQVRNTAWTGLLDNAPVAGRPQHDTELLRYEAHSEFTYEEQSRPEPRLTPVQPLSLPPSLPPSPPHEYPLEEESQRTSHTLAGPPSHATREAAAALQQLALHRQSHQETQQHSTHTITSILPGPRPNTETRKRPRPHSIDLSTSVEGAVRALIAPRCLGDITNMVQRSNRGEDNRTVLPDDQLAGSFLLRKENRHAVREANKKPTKPVRTGLGEIKNGGSVRRPKTSCAGSERGGRCETRLMEKGGESLRRPFWGEVLR